jgi:hypothetical protein
MTHSTLGSALLFLASVVPGACQPRPFTPKPPPPFTPTAAPQISAQGVVLSVERPRPEDSQSYVHLLVSPADHKPVRLVLGPGWYLEREGMRFEPNESVRFHGRSVSREGRSGIEVQRIEHGQRSYILRDDQNRPAWTVMP